MNVFDIYVCTEHETGLKHCCKEAEHIGWLDQRAVEEAVGD